VLATLATERTEVLRDGGESAAAALNSGYHLAYLIGAALVLVAIGVALAVLRPAAVSAHEQDPDGALDGAEPAYSEAA
jgi:hypothetical protein